MAEAGYWMSSRAMKPISSTYPAAAAAEAKSLNNILSRTSNVRAASKKNEFSLITKKSNSKRGGGPRRRMIKISTSDGKWDDKWNCEYILSLQQLQLDDLAEEDVHAAASAAAAHSQVSINLSIHKHASFGLSVEGRIISSFTRKCSTCSSPYSTQIDTNFNVWVLQSSQRHGSSTQLPEIGGDDPSVIYVKPGCEADLDSLIQDTIRLTASVKETCSELCEKSEPKVQHIGEHKAASTDGRWSRLLELRNAYHLS